MSESINECAREIMDTVPQIVQAIRVEMRLGHGANISIPQFRTLRFVQRNPHSSLSALAEHLGLTPPSVSKLVDVLVRQDLINRKESISDRRQLTLELTNAGESIVNFARSNAQANLAKTLSCLSDSDLEIIKQALELLHPLFAQQRKQSVTKN